VNFSITSPSGQNWPKFHLSLYPASSSGGLLLSAASHCKACSGMKGSYRTHANVRFGSNADLTAPKRDFRSSPRNGHQATTAACPKRAKRRPSAVRQECNLLDQLVRDAE
jgi:hypothetical protein